MNHWSRRQNFTDHFIRALLTEMAAFELTVQTAVCGYHVYNEESSWPPTIGDKFTCHEKHNCIEVIIRCEVKWRNEGR